MSRSSAEGGIHLHFFKDWAITNLLAELVFVSREYVGTNDCASLVMILMDNASSFDLQNP